MKLRDQTDGCDRVDALEAAQPADRLAVRLLPAELGESRVELLLPFLELSHRQHVTVERRLTHRIVEAELFKPRPVPRAPVVLRLSVDAVAPQQELGETVPRPQQIYSNIVSTPAQVAQRLL